MNFEYNEEGLEIEQEESVECNFENKRIREIRKIAEDLLDNYQFFDKEKVLEVVPEKEIGMFLFLLHLDGELLQKHGIIL